MPTPAGEADPETLRQTAIALCYSTAEYCAPVWTRSCHAHKVDPELNRSCRIITGTLKPTPLPSLYRVAGITPPSIRRETISRTEKNNQISDPRHPLHPHQVVRQRLKSRKSFTTVEGLEKIKQHHTGLKSGEKASRDNKMSLSQI